MQYRKLGRTSLEVSGISLGTEFLIYEAPENAIAVLREAVARGVNYFDTFWPQPGFRDMLGTAFKGVRDTVHLAAHLGAVMYGDQYGRGRDPQAAEKFFFDYLRRVGTDYVDALYLHNCDAQEDLDCLMKPGGLLELARRFQGEGKARFIGLSSHNAETARKAVESGAIDMLMFPVNLASFAVPGQKELYRACAACGVGLVVMKPFGGGSLLREKSTITVEDYQSGRMQLAGAPMHFEQPAIKITATHCLAYILDQVLYGALAGFQAVCQRRMRVLQPLPAVSFAHRYRPDDEPVQPGAAESDRRAAHGLHRAAGEGLRVHPVP
jgi:aryl-alcohol dehydrogenase-like predicted oxidoreductase